MGYDNPLQNEYEGSHHRPANNHQVNQSGNCVIEGCPCRGWSAQERITYACPNCGKVDEHSDSCPSRPRTSEQPAARGGGDEWHVGSRSNSPEGDATIYTVKGRRWVGQVKASLADQIVTEHNQHHSLVAERDALVEVLQLIQGFNWQLDDSPHGREIKRRTLEAINQKRGAR